MERSIQRKAGVGNKWIWRRWLQNDWSRDYGKNLMVTMEPGRGTYWTQIKTRRRSFLYCNFDAKDYTICSQFHRELLLWLSQFRGTFASESNWQRINWNNKEIRIDKKPLYLKNYYEYGIVYVNDLLFNLSSNDSSDYFAKKLVKLAFFNWKAFDTLYLTF